MRVKENWPMNEITAVTATEAFALHTQVLELKKDIGARFLALGQVLYTMRHDGLYKAINPGMSWEAYCAMPEVSISPSHARNLMRIYEVFSLNLNVPMDELAGVDQRKLTAILPKVDANNVENLLADAKHLSRSDLTQLMKGTESDHEHHWQVITYQRCNICYEERNRSKTDATG